MTARPVTAQQLEQLSNQRGPQRVLAFYGQRRIAVTLDTGRLLYVGQRQDRPLASWETVITTTDAEHASQWLADARLPSTEAYAHYTQRTAELDADDPRCPACGGCVRCMA